MKRAGSGHEKRSGVRLPGGRGWRFLWLGLVVTLMACQGPPAEKSPIPPTATVAPVRPLRLFWVDSYRAGDLWSAQIRLGLVETLARQGYSETEETLVWEVFYLDVRSQSSVVALQEQVTAARAAVAAFAPDVLLISDDEAIQALVPAYAGTELPVVFCGLSNEALLTGWSGAPNVTGVLERPQVGPTLRLVQAFIPEARRMLYLGDSSSAGWSTYLAVVSQLQRENPLGQPPRTRLTDEWGVWQQVVLSETAAVDFILLGPYDQLYRPDGSLVSPTEVMQWTWAYSPVPVFALWDFTVQEGAVGGLTIARYEQGAEAARLIAQVWRGRSPAELPPRPPQRHLLAVNLAAAQHWQLPIPVQFPLTAQTYRRQPAPLEGGQ